MLKVIIDEVDCQSDVRDLSDGHGQEKINRGETSSKNIPKQKERK